MLRDDWQETYGQPHLAFFYVELVCNIWFIIELAIRLVVSGVLKNVRRRMGPLLNCFFGSSFFIGFAKLLPIYQIPREHN